ncbi:hypothetical protein [Mycobacterium sp.]|uniref:hypothetical protein n=1 Tax=Mycobacterium sp. TaxID=1785 RepID=UPI003BAE61CC
MKRLIAGLATTVLLWGSVAVIVGTGTAQGLPGGPFPLGQPGCPANTPANPRDPYGPCHWCPGQPLPQTGNHRTNPVVWDMGICHTYWFVMFGQGNAAQNVFDGDNPPAPPPEPPPGLNFCPIPPWCP